MCEWNPNRWRPGASWNGSFWRFCLNNAVTVTCRHVIKVLTVFDLPGLDPDDMLTLWSSELCQCGLCRLWSDVSACTLVTALHLWCHLAPELYSWEFEQMLKVQVFLSKKVKWRNEKIQKADVSWEEEEEEGWTQCLSSCSCQTLHVVVSVCS